MEPFNTEDIADKGVWADANIGISGVADATVKAVKAGADIVILSAIVREQKNAHEAIVRAVETGEISEERINESLRRIFRVKTEIARRSSVN
jgi:beta-N-acetylhexosaminidase